jgi:anthranilate phosphoribosyltransferase
MASKPSAELNFRKRVGTKMNTQKVTNAIIEGIKNVGVGKKGSKPCSPELVSTICSEVSADVINRAALGAFYGALYMKGVEEAEQPLIEALSADAHMGAEQFISALFSEAPAQIEDFAVALLNEKSLSTTDAEVLGNYLFADNANETAKGFFASVLRVKYETIDEYCGLLNAMRNASCDMNQIFPNTDKLVQLAEPFDGMNRSYLLTPIIGKMLTDRGYDALNLVGRSSGPKFGTNLLSIADNINSKFIQKDFPVSSSSNAYYLTQKELSPAIDGWVETRISTIKRPFLATLEKLVNPCNAQIGFFSAFHAPYAEKMVDLALLNGFKGAISVFKSMEGSLGLATGRACQMICGVRTDDGQIIKETFEFSPEEFGLDMYDDKKLEDVTPQNNASLINSYLGNGSSGDEYFDARAQFTVAAYQKALDWIENVE